MESLKKLLEDSKHKVYLYSKHSNDIKTPWDKIRIAFGLFWNPQTDRELTKIIKEFKPDVAHLNNLYPMIGPTAITTLNRNKIRIVQTIHNYRFMCPKGLLFRKGKICELCIHLRLPFWAILFGCYHQSRVASLFFSFAYLFHRSILHTFDKINLFIFPSKFTQIYYQKHLGLNKKISAYLPHFVDIKPPKKPVKKGDYYLFVGRLSEEKGIIELLEKFKNMPDKKLKVVGTGPLWEQVKAYRKYKNIEICGYVERAKIAPIIQAANALFVSSLWLEVLPISVLEAIQLRIKIVILYNKELFKELSELSNEKLDFYSPKPHLSKIVNLYAAYKNNNE